MSDARGDACTRDHTNSTSYRKAMAAQEHYRVSNIIDVIWNEESGILSAVEHIIDEEFAEKIRQNKSIYRSPALWPRRSKSSGRWTGARRSTCWTGMPSIRPISTILHSGRRRGCITGARATGRNASITFRP